MIEGLLQGRYANARLHHVRMAFAKDMDDMGRWRPGKLFHAVAIVAAIVWARVRHGTDVLYFPPSGPDLWPMLRDLAILVPTRWMFRKTILHFHAAGTSKIYPRLPHGLRALYRLGYGKPDLAILTSEFNPDDATFLGARRRVVVPCGVDDDYLAMGCPQKPVNEICNILFVGLVSESKGALILLEAMRLLKERGVVARLTVVGKLVSDQFRKALMARIEAGGLQDVVTFTGVLVGPAKHDQYLNADIFCFPTFFKSESFGLVVVEAMQFKVPVVATRWRGVQSVVRDGDNGYLVPPHDASAVAERLAQLISAPILRRQMGERGREIYLCEYTMERFYRRVDESFSKI